MAIKIELTGKRFGKLTVLEKTNKRSKCGAVLWKCKCDCGKEKFFRTSELTTMNRRSCGCLIAETTRKKSTKHGGCGTRLYKIWDDMKSRCYNPKFDSYRFYGQKGIIICQEWLNFENFRDWSLQNGYKENLTIDRIDSNKNYEPVNCRWVTQKEQARNTSRTIYITQNGLKKPLREWCEILNLKPVTVMARIKKGYPEELLLVKRIGKGDFIS